MPEQMVLPFGYQFAEDRASLLIAIGAAKLRRLDRAFVLMVHDVTRNGWLHKSYQEIAERLNVSYSTARRSVARCLEAHLITVQEERYRSGGQRDNAYSIDWDGVRAKCFNATLTEGPAAHPEQPPAHFEHPPAHPEQAPAQTEHPYKEYIPPSDPPKNPPPPQKSRGGGGFSETEDWGAIKSRLESIGMLDSVGAIKAARESQLAPGDVIAIISEWESSRPAWSLGGLYWRLSRGNWPEPSAEYAQLQQRALDDRRRSQQQAELASIRRESEEEAARLERLERRAGPGLDSLTPDELEQLVERVYPDPWQRAYYERERASPLVRLDLLLEIDRSLQEATR